MPKPLTFIKNRIKLIIILLVIIAIAIITGLMVVNVRNRKARERSLEEIAKNADINSEEYRQGFTNSCLKYTGHSEKDC